MRIYSNETCLYSSTLVLEQTKRVAVGGAPLLQRRIMSDERKLLTLLREARNAMILSQCAPTIGD